MTEIATEPHVPEQRKGRRMDAEGAVVITPLEIYKEVTSLTRSVDKLLAKDEETARDQQRVEGRVEKIEERVGRVEDRMTSVEKRLLVFACLAATLGGGIGGYLGPLLHASS